MEGRVHGEYDAIETPIGQIPRYEDVAPLFKKVFDVEYDKTRYESEFSVRVDKWIAKLDRMADIYKDEDDIPAVFTDTLAALRKRLEDARSEHGMDEIPPAKFA